MKSTVILLLLSASSALAGINTSLSYSVAPQPTPDLSAYVQTTDSRLIMASPTTDGRMSKAHFSKLATLPTTFFSGSWNDLADKPALLKGEPGATGSSGPAGATGAQGVPGVNATTTATATSTAAGLMPAAAVSTLAKIVPPVPVTVSIPAVSLAGSYTAILTVPGAQVGGVPIVTFSDTALQGDMQTPWVSAANTVTVPIKAVLAITAGSRTFNVAVINP